LGVERLEGGSTPHLGEVADKEPPITAIWCIAAFLCGLLNRRQLRKRRRRTSSPNLLHRTPGVSGAGSVSQSVRRECSEVLNRRKLRERRGGLHLRFLVAFCRFSDSFHLRAAWISFRVFGVFRGYISGLSFAVQRPQNPSAIDSLILIRTPKYEFIFEEHERGVKVFFERRNDDEDDLLQKFDYVEADAIVRIQTSSQEYELDVRKVDAEELKKMRKILKKMNHDQKFQTTGI
jgi:hypothetical protein